MVTLSIKTITELKKRSTGSYVKSMEENTSCATAQTVYENMTSVDT